MIDLSGINEKVNDTILNCKEDGYHRYKKEKDIIANQYKDKIIKSKDQLRDSIDTFLSLNTNNLELTRDAKHLKIAINTDKTEIVSIKNLKDFDYFYNKSEKLLKEINENINKFDNLTIEYLLNLILTLYNNKIISEEDLNDFIVYEEQYENSVGECEIKMVIEKSESRPKIVFRKIEEIQLCVKTYNVNLYGLTDKKAIIENLKIFIEKMCN
jgi:hypothetical protein